MKSSPFVIGICFLVFVLLLGGGHVQAQAPAKTIKIGVSSFLGFKVGLGTSRCVQVLADMDNKKGGLDIGGAKYKVEIISYDSKMDITTVLSNINRMIFEDKVKYIVADPIMTAPWLPVADQNGVVVVAGGSFPQLFNKNFRSVFQTGLSNTNAPVALAWYANKYPNKKNMVFATPEMQAGREYAKMWKTAWEAFGGKCTIEYFPPAAQDLSSLATKIKNSKADVFSTIGGMNDQAVFKAVMDAGFKGSYLSFVTPQDLSAIIPAKSLEGVVNWMPCMVMEQPSCKLGSAFKAAYTAKYGKWDYPVTLFSTGYSAITAAMQKAGSTDPQKVAAVLNSGLRFETTEGPVEMISRPDMGINRTMDSIHPLDFGEYKNGKIVPLDSVSIEQGTKWFRQIYK